MTPRLEFGQPDGHRRVWGEERCFRTCTVSHLCVHQRRGSKARNRKTCDRQKGIQHGGAEGRPAASSGADAGLAEAWRERRQLPAGPGPGAHAAQHGGCGFPRLGVPLLGRSPLRLQVVPGLASWPCGDWGLGNRCRTNKQKATGKTQDRTSGRAVFCRLAVWTSIEVSSALEARVEVQIF